MARCGEFSSDVLSSRAALDCYGESDNFKEPSANWTSASNATTATTVSTTEDKTYQGYSSVASTSTQMMHTGLWIDADINDVRVDLCKIQLGTNLAPLGRGAFCEVLAATFDADHQKVAVKRIQPTKQTNHVLQNMLLAEVKVLVSLKHKYIVQLLGVAWETPSDLCIVMEYVKGTDMDKYITANKHNRSHRGFTTEKVLMALEIADALVYLHGQDPPVVHHDLKPSNILVTDDYQTKITGFGEAPDYDGMLAVGPFGITNLCMAPELTLGFRYDAKIDIYSFGVLLSELDTLEAPYSQSLNSRAVTYNLFQCVLDGRLTVTFSEDESSPMVLLARECLRVDPRGRPEATELFGRLQKIYYGFTEQDKGAR